jgi:hypothetical protein
VSALAAILAVISGLFRSLSPRVIALILAVVTAVAWAHHRERAADMTGYSRGHAEWVALDAEMKLRALAATEVARTEEQRRAAAQKEVEDAHEAEMRRARADAAIADSAAGRLRERVASLVASSNSAGTSNSPAIRVGPPAKSAAGVCADVLVRLLERGQLLARVADERGAAGTACEQSYDSLKGPTE